MQQCSEQFEDLFDAKFRNEEVTCVVIEGRTWDAFEIRKQVAILHDLDVGTNFDAEKMSAA